MKIFEKSIESLTELVQYYIVEYMRMDPLELYRDGLQIERFAERQRALKQELDCASYSDASVRMNVKTFIQNILTDKESRIEAIRFSGRFKDIRDDFLITQKNIGQYMRFQDQIMSAETKFRILLIHHMKTEGRNAVVHMIQRYGWDKLKKDRVGELSRFVSRQDIDSAYRDAHIQLTYDIKLALVVQRIYEATYGNRIVDELLYQRTLEGVSIGAYGIPQGMDASNFPDVQLPSAYDAVSVGYMDMSIRLEFLSCGSEDGLEDVVRKLIRSENGEPMNTSTPYYRGDRQGSDRVVAAQPPFAECYMAWVRFHGRKMYSLEDLITGKAMPVPPEEPGGYQLLIDALTFIMQGRINLIVTGPQNMGKTTVLSAAAKLIDPNLRLRSSESQFEALLRSMYPMRDIGSFRETREVDMKDGFEKSLQTNGQIAFLPEVRRDAVYAQAITMGKRGVFALYLTSHQKAAEDVPSEMANALLTSRLYQSIDEGVRSILSTFPFCLEVKIDPDTKLRYYNLCEYVVREKETLDFGSIKDPQERMLMLLETAVRHMTTRDYEFETVPIVRFNPETWSYEKCSVFSKKEEEKMRANMPRTVRDRLTVFQKMIGG